MITSGAKKQTVNIPNVLFAERKVEAIRKLIVVEPSSYLATVDENPSEGSG